MRSAGHGEFVGYVDLKSSYEITDDSILDFSRVGRENVRAGSIVKMLVLTRWQHVSITITTAGDKLVIIADWVKNFSLVTRGGALQSSTQCFTRTSLHFALYNP